MLYTLYIIMYNLFFLLRLYLINNFEPCLFLLQNQNYDRHRRFRTKIFKLLGRVWFELRRFQNLNAIDDQLFVKICWKISSFVFVICISFWAPCCILYDFFFILYSRPLFRPLILVFFSIFIGLINNIFWGGVHAFIDMNMNSLNNATEYYVPLS